MDSRQRAYVENRVRGLGRQQSAIMAGYGDYENAGVAVEDSQKVQAELARIRAETAKNTKITKEMVAEGLKTAADLAQQMADPQGMVAAWRELGKLLGFYAPEVKRLEKGINKKDLLAAMDQMSDEELLKLKGGRIVDGTVTERTTERVPELPPPSA